MIKLGVNSVLYQGHELAVAMEHIARIGYDGIELSAIKGMCEHLELDKWETQADAIKALAEQHKLALLSMEVASLDEERLMRAFAAAKAIGVPVVNIGPGGKSNVEEDFVKSQSTIAKMSEKAAEHGVTLCVKAHVNCVVYNTPTTLRLMHAIKSKGFGVDMDPSHIFRANELPEEALPAVLSRVKHIHIRDCKGRGPTPGEPKDQACGKGDIDLWGYFSAMTVGKYEGPVCLEVIGAGKYELWQRDTIAAESYGYMNAILKQLGAR